MKIAHLLVAGLFVLTLGACADDVEQSAAPATQSGTTTEQQSTTVVEATTGSGGPSCAAGFVMVSAQANIFGGGSDFAPGPGGGGGGALPPSLQLPDGSTVVTFPRITGKVTPLHGYAGYNRAGGDRVGATDVESYGGISGIVDRQSGMFLVGVFLTDEPPATSAPQRLDFTKRERFRTLAPRVGQTFFVGDGRGRTFRVPRGATRLFLGFADSYSNGRFYEGHPGYYDNNGGHLCARVEVA